MYALKTLVLLPLLTLGMTAATCSMAQEHHAPGQALSMSPELLELYREEMRQLLAATQSLAVAIPIGGWDSIIATSHRMRDSYVLEGQLTESQKAEIAGLPEHFQDLDHGFHARTDKLAAAAEAKDAEAAAYQFSRLLETCAVCHTHYAQSRFPAFPAAPEQGHHH